MQRGSRGRSSGGLKVSLDLFYLIKDILTEKMYDNAKKIFSNWKSNEDPPAETVFILPNQKSKNSNLVMVQYIVQGPFSVRKNRQWLI